MAVRQPRRRGPACPRPRSAAARRASTAPSAARIASPSRSMPRRRRRSSSTSTQTSTVPGRVASGAASRRPPPRAAGAGSTGTQLGEAPGVASRSARSARSRRRRGGAAAGRGARRRRAGRPTRRAGRRGGRRPSPGAARASAAARVVLPDPAGPSMQTSRPAPEGRAAATRPRRAPVGRCRARRWGGCSLRRCPRLRRMASISAMSSSTGSAAGPESFECAGRLRRRLLPRGLLGRVAPPRWTPAVDDPRRAEEQHRHPRHDDAEPDRGAEDQAGGPVADGVDDPGEHPQGVGEVGREREQRERRAPQSRRPARGGGRRSRCRCHRPGSATGPALPRRRRPCPPG